MIGVEAALGSIAFAAHLAAYLWYAYGVFHERIRPNAASWLMWLIGGWIEYATYTHIVGSHWSTSALPLACVFGLAIIFVATATVQLRERARGTHAVVWHKPDTADYYLILCDLIALVIWLAWDAAEIANVIAVATSIVTYVPIWRTTYRHPHQEHIGPWALWVFAYLVMFAAVLVVGGDGVFWKSFYPLYYAVLSAGVIIAALMSAERRIRA